jgi:peptidoglycan-N-acetylglucosamine deacetylase
VTTPRIVTTSWDDGDCADLRIAEMLDARGLAGTFYIPITLPAGPFKERPALNREQVRRISDAGFEIGAHSVSHVSLRGLRAAELAKEVSGCKPMLEQIAGRPVRMFCYPWGRYDARVIEALREAGYSGGRTVQMLATGLEFDPFEMPTTVQGFSHPQSNYFKNALKARKIAGLQICLTNRKKLSNWVELSKALFDSVMENGGVWHLYGHSWEVDHCDLWDDLQRVLDYVSRRPGVTYASNAELLEFLPGSGQAVSDRMIPQRVVPDTIATEPSGRSRTS